MLVMREAVPSDRDAVAALILARCAWLEDRGMESWRSSLDDVVEQTDNPAGDTWVLATDDGRVVGRTTVQEHGPAWGWTPEELAEPARYLYTTITDPALREWRPGSLIAWWAVDRAAREGFGWVRRGCYFPGLVRYYRSQGFELLHEVPRKTRTVYLLGRRAEVLPELAGQFAQPLSSRA